MQNEFYFPSATGNGKIYCIEHAPDKGEIKVVLQFTHGMAEHIRRYDEFAAYLNSRGIAFIGMDLAGHGKSTENGETLGYFGDGDGWSGLVEDIHTLYKIGKEKYPNVPYVLMGHSMGSFWARTYASRHGNDVDAFIFSATAGKNRVLGIAKAIAKGEIKKHGAKTPSAKLDSLSFGAYNKQFRPNRTNFDWLSRDNSQVDKYVEDKYCGFIFSAKAFLDLFNGLSEIGSYSWAEKVAKKPILMIAGGNDPVGSNAKGVREVAEWLVASGHDVKLRIYDGGRHEMLNETNRDEVMKDIADFVEQTNAI